MKRRYNNTRGSSAVGVIIVILVIIVAAVLVYHFFIKGGSSSGDSSIGYYTSGGKLYCYHGGKTSEISDYSSDSTDSVRISSDGKYIFYYSGDALKVNKVDGSSAETIADKADEFAIKSDGTEVIYYAGNTIYFQKISNGKKDGDKKTLAENCTGVVSLYGGDDKVSAYYVGDETEKVNTIDYIVDIPSKPSNNAQRTLINDLKASQLEITHHTLNYASEDTTKIVDDNVVYENATNTLTMTSSEGSETIAYQRGTFEPEVSFNAITSTKIDDAEGEVKIAFNVPSGWYIATGTTPAEIGSITPQTEVSALSDDGKVLYYFDNYSEDVQYEYADLMRLDLVGNNQPTKVCEKVYTGTKIDFIGEDTPVYLMLEDIDQYKLGAGNEKRSEEGTLVRADAVKANGSTVAFITTDGDLYIYTDGGEEAKAVKADSGASDLCCITAGGSVIYTAGSGEVRVVTSSDKPSAIK